MDQAAPGADRSAARVCFVILDGWGLREATWDNAVTRANAPTWRQLWEEGDYPRATAHHARPAPWASPRGRWATRRWATSTWARGGWCGRACSASPTPSSPASSPRNDVFLRACSRGEGARRHAAPDGAVGPGGVHAVDEHLLALVRPGAAARACPAVRMHLFLDGRDTPPQRARDFLTELFGRAGCGDRVQGGHADGPLLGDGPRQALGAHRSRRTARWCTARASPCTTRCRRWPPPTQAGETRRVRAAAGDGGRGRRARGRACATATG